jgi:hypothetical protein
MNTTYNYRVKSRDSSGSLGTSSNFTFTTPASTVNAPLLYLQFNESSGTVTVDSSGHGLNGALVDGATFNTGISGNAVVLNGSTQSVDLGNPAALQLTGSMTVSGWIKATSFPSDDAAIVSKRNIPQTGFQLDATADNGPRTISFKLTSSSGSAVIRYGASTLSTNTWYYVTGVYDATAQTVNVYLNGQLDNGILVGTVTGTQQDSGLHVYVGRRAGSTGFEFPGSIDDVRVYGRPLTQVEIQSDLVSVQKRRRAQTTSH